MHSFEESFLALHCERLPSEVVRLLTSLAEYKGKQDLYKNQDKEILAWLREDAKIRSVVSSNRLEGITARRDMSAIMKMRKRTTFRRGGSHRGDYELLGYRNVLQSIYEGYDSLPFRLSYILQFHRDLMSPAGYEHVGQWKSVPNDIRENVGSPQERVRFSTVSPALVDASMNNLHVGFDRAMALETIAPLVLIPLYILDFLCIHPFLDGNGRMARLVANWLLLRQGYEVPLYRSIERIIEDEKKGYYDSLNLSSEAWHQGKHNPLHWVTYFLQVLLYAYKEWERNVQTQIKGGAGAKKKRVIRALQEVEQEFSIERLAKLCPTVALVTVRQVLAELQQQGRVVCVQKGRYARWRRNDSVESHRRDYGMKSRAVLDEIQKRGNEDFTAKELEESCSAFASRDLVRYILGSQRRKGALVCSGRGRGAYWRRKEGM